MVVDQLPRLGKRELICLLSFTCNYVVFVWRGFLFLWVLGMGYVILLWHSLSLPYNYSISNNNSERKQKRSRAWLIANISILEIAETRSIILSNKKSWACRLICIIIVRLSR